MMRAELEISHYEFLSGKYFGMFFMVLSRKIDDWSSVTEKDSNCDVNFEMNRLARNEAPWRYRKISVLHGKFVLSICAAHTVEPWGAGFVFVLEIAIKS